MNYLDEFDLYIEELFRSQFDISEELISHPLEKGQTREDFIKSEIIRRFNHINIQKGFITGATRETSPQMDMLILKSTGQTRMLGNNLIADINDLNVVIEVKSNATGTDIREFNANINTIREQNPDVEMPLFGMFCYKIALKKKSIYERFGYIYDEDNDLLKYNLEQEKINDNDYSELELEYPNIDFILSIDKSDEYENKFIFLRKGYDRNHNPYYVSLKDRPITKHLWNIIKGR